MAGAAPLGGAGQAKPLGEVHAALLADVRTLADTLDHRRLAALGPG